MFITEVAHTTDSWVSTNKSNLIKIIFYNMLTTCFRKLCSRDWLFTLIGKHIEV